MLQLYVSSATAQPFMLNVHFDSEEVAELELGKTGFCLNYMLTRAQLVSYADRHALPC